MNRVNKNREIRLKAKGLCISTILNKIRPPIGVWVNSSDTAILRWNN